MRKMEKQGLFIQFSIAKLSAIIMCIMTETQRQAEEWESLYWNKGKATGMSGLDAVGTGKFESS